MEQHDTQLRRRDTLLARLSNPSNSLPAPPPSATTQTTTAEAPGLSASEPTLRFPRPQGNTQLANWISSSNPNMMDMAPPADDNGLAESTYELISSPSTDNEESQDDRYPASMGESVGSLDIHRPDDVRSLAGTDDSFGTDNDDADTHGASSDRDDTEDEEDDEDSVHEDTVLTESQITHDEANKTEPFPPFKNDAYSQESQELLEYTDQSLGTPSYTPEASRVIERPADHEKKSFKKKMSELWQLESQAKEFLVENTWGAFPGFVFVVVILVVLPIFYGPASKSALPNVEMPPSITATVTTTSYLTTSTSSLSPSSSSSSLIPSATNGLALMPLGEAQSDDWIFGAKKPVVSFTAEEHNDILIHIPNSIKKTWLAKECLTVTAKRGEVPVDTTMSLVDEGLYLKFAKKETHGVVNVILEAKCRPKIHKVVKVHFGKGLMEGALERTKHLAHLAQDLSGLVPAAAQEAERRIENAKQSLGSACQNVCQTVTETVSKTFGASFANFVDVRQQLDDLVSTAKTQFDEATQGITSKIDKITQQATENLPSVEDMQNQLQLQLLDAQLSAKLLWLQAFGSADEHEEYLRKAKSYSADKHAAAAQSKLKHAKKEVQEKLTESASRLWSMLRGKPACRQNSHEQCKATP
ncbi:hypothetical protein THARTR1_03449 [Trichoderma harzianum]|uniref:Uncharacterized protein n=1 Tax=Trichoderma harzianum TaxID=5544 RepID=A0A2K0UG42_TRIHA|nr:hypothetical protein THARTR1_03449 [Trichoderma harzianum]